LAVPDARFAVRHAPVCEGSVAPPVGGATSCRLLVVRLWRECGNTGSGLQLSESARWSRSYRQCAVDVQDLDLRHRRLRHSAGPDHRADEREPTYCCTSPPAAPPKRSAPLDGTPPVPGIQRGVRGGPLGNGMTVTAPYGAASGAPAG